jgi:hypothetical protein
MQCTQGVRDGMFAGGALLCLPDGFRGKFICLLPGNLEQLKVQHKTLLCQLPVINQLRARVPLRGSSRAFCL